MQQSVFNSRTRRAFTLVEVLIAIFVITVGMLGTISALVFGAKAAQHSDRMTEATNHAREVIEQVRSSNLVWANPLNPALNQTDSARSPLNAGPAPLTNLPSDSNMTRNIQIIQGIGPDPEMANIARVRVRVFFVIKGHEKVVELMAFEKKGP